MEVQQPATDSKIVYVLECSDQPEWEEVRDRVSTIYNQALNPYQ